MLNGGIALLTSMEKIRSVISSLLVSKLCYLFWLYAKLNVHELPHSANDST